MTISFKRQIVTVIRPVWVEERGDLIPDWANATEHLIPGCRVQPAQGDEVHDNRDAVVDRWSLFAPAAADIQPLDRVRHLGVVYEVDGSVRHWPSPTGALAHVEASLVRVEG